MPAGTTVRPQKWSNVIDLFDDGTNSAIWGNYDSDSTRSLGVRWNENYPVQGSNPVWYVEPDCVTKSILLALLARVNSSEAPIGNINNILLALREHPPEDTGS
jgi:hypothetical protein